MVIFIVLSLYYGFVSTGVDNAAHIGGAVTGFLLSIIMYKKKRRRDNYDSFYNDTC